MERKHIKYTITEAARKGPFKEKGPQRVLGILVILCVVKKEKHTHTHINPKLKTPTIVPSSVRCTFGISFIR